MTAKRTVVFVYQHGAAKRVLAAGLLANGIDVTAWQPRPVTPATFPSLAGRLLRP